MSELETLYTPESQVRNFRRLWHEMWHGLKQSKELAWQLIHRDLAAMYRQSILGFVWAFLPSLVTAGVFIFLNHQKILTIRPTDIPYPVYVLFGTIFWQTFIESINAPLKSVSGGMSMIARIRLPYEAFLISAFGQVIFNLCSRLVILALVFMVFKLPFTWGIFLAPGAILMLILFGFCIGLFATPFGVLYKDVQNAINVGATFWFFLTPVVYPPPESFPFSLLARFNPVSPLIMSARDLATKGVWSDPIGFLVVSLLTLGGLVLAWILYRLSIPILIERMGS